MREEITKIYNRQTARCLSDIQELYDIPAMVTERIKKAIEYTAKDVDKLTQGVRNGSKREISGNK